jgi:hypothetical protein
MQHHAAELTARSAYFLGELPSEEAMPLLKQVWTEIPDESPYRAAGLRETLVRGYAEQKATTELGYDGHDADLKVKRFTDEQYAQFDNAYTKYLNEAGTALRR